MESQSVLQVESQAKFFFELGPSFHTAKTSDGLTEGEARRGLRMLCQKGGMRKINFAGGEPFLRPKFLGNLVRYCKKELGINTSIITNGSRVTEDWFRKYGEYLDILGVRDYIPNIAFGLIPTQNKA